MAKYSWSDYCGTQEPRKIVVEVTRRGDDPMVAYGFNPGVCTRMDHHDDMEVFEFGKSCGFYLVCEAKSAEQAGFLFRKFLKEAVKAYIERDVVADHDLFAEKRA